MGLELLETRKLLATLTVNTTVDALDLDPGNGTCEISGGGCSLRAAIQEANALGSAADAHVINLPAGTYRLTIDGTDESESRTGDLNIQSSLEIVGQNAADTIIDAGGLDRAIDVILGTVTIQNVTIQGGVIDADEEAFEFVGGGVRNQGNLTLIDSVVTGNTAGSGAGLANYNGTLKLLRSVITGNGDSATTRGGGIFNYANYDSASLEIIESSISGNEASAGGGVMNFSYDGVANAVIQRSTIAGNTANTGGGIANRSRIYIEPTSFSNLSIRGSTLSGNTAMVSGGGIYTHGVYGGAAEVDILNSTITGNVATGLDGGGIRSVDGDQVSTVIRSTIVAGNSAGRNGDDLYGQSISGTFNLIGNAEGHLFVNGTDANLVGIAARLGPLADNGGPTLTHELLDGSPAIDQGFNSLGLISDQRGNAFQRTVDLPSIENASDGTDIGAVETAQVASVFDFGDAPDGISVNSQLRNYPTLLSNDGARHRIDPLGPFLGQLRPDAESDGPSSAGANGDDLIGVDDEDSLTGGSVMLTPGQPINNVNLVHNGSSSGAFLNVWLDVNADGDWNDLGEHIVVDRAVSSGVGTTSLSDVTLSPNATVGRSFIRVRISTASGLAPTGGAPDGEVEDFQVTIGDQPVQTADLSLMQTVDDKDPTIGDIVTFTITVTNDGPDPATSVEVTNLLPPDLLFEQATVTQGDYEMEETWFVGRLLPGASAELRIRAKVDSTDSLAHTAEITFVDQGDPDSTPGNGISGEDDQSTVILGTCLSGGPIHAGMNRFTFSCASPGAWVGFVHGTTRGSKVFDQYNVTVDIEDAEGVAISIADSQGIASALINISDEVLNDIISQNANPLIIQAFEMFPSRVKSNTLLIDSEVAMLRARDVGAGGVTLDVNVIQPVVNAVKARWSLLPLPNELRRRLENTRFIISDLPNDIIARAVGRTIVLDNDAAGNGWYVDPTPGDDREFDATSVAGSLHAVDTNAIQRIDLVTTLMHEFGHLLDLPDVTNLDNVMHRTLEIGVRRIPVPNTNPNQSLDVNRDNRVSARDALHIINWLGRQSLHSSSTSSLWIDNGALDSHYFDANADFHVSAADALLVINHLSYQDVVEMELATTMCGPVLDSTRTNRIDEPPSQILHFETIVDALPKQRKPTTLPDTLEITHRGDETFDRNLDALDLLKDRVEFATNVTNPHE